MLRGMTRAGLVAAVALTASVCTPAAAAAQDFLEPNFLASIDDAQFHGTVTPPGSDTRHATTELAAYDDLVQGYPKLTFEELTTRYFKNRVYGPIADPQRTYSPRGDVTVVRDAKWGEPHVFGKTDAGMAFGIGYATAEDRLAMMELLRALGRAEAFQLAGTAPAWFADMEAARLYGYTEEEWQSQIDRLPRVYGKIGDDFIEILNGYVEGINAFIAEAERGEVPLPAGLSDLGIKAPAPWRPTDVVAAVSTVRALFGAGGGSEMSNAAVFAGLVGDLGTRLGRQVYEDFRSRNNEDGPVHTTKRFPYITRDESKLDPNATAVEPPEGGPAYRRQAREIATLAERSRIKWERLKLSTKLGTIDLSRSGGMSNHLVVGASRSANGRPILIGGPQAGYFSPEILLDYELHSPTIHARGAGFPGLSAVVVMGRTQDYAWTPTAGGSDMIDTYVEKLCEPGGGTPTEDSRFYEFKGECRPMDRRTLRQAPPGTGYPDIIVERTVHGPVVSRGTLKDQPVAVSQKRSSYLKELDAAISILKMNRNQARTGSDFVDIFRESHNLSTNWSYANDHEIAYVHGGLYPRRPDAADPDLPVWGTGQWEWATDSNGEDVFLPRSQVPHEVAPKRDFIVSWNNKPAPGWGSADAQWGHTSIYRASLLEDAILRQKPGTITPVKLTQMMEQAGLTDLRGSHVAPLALRVLKRASGVGARERRMIELLEQWIADGALRRDGDGDGNYERSAAVAIMDAWWEKLIRAVYDPVLGNSGRIPLGFDNAPGLAGSAYQDGWYGYLWTDLSMVLGERVKSRTSRIYCGGSRTASGNFDECAKRMLESLVAAGDELGGDDPSAWSADAEAERIRFLPGVALSMHWVNRPTFQQIAQFGRRDRPPSLGLKLAYRRGGGGCARSVIRATLGGRDAGMVESVEFFTNGRRVAGDRTAPFRKSVHRDPHGRSHPHRVAARVKLRGRARRVTLRQMFRTCDGRGAHR
jgi:acyl-homoserine lactone acylase PvdQ